MPPSVRERLETFLRDPSRPADTLSYHELQGFLFAVAACPDLVRPSEWMPEVFGAQSARYRDLDEARTITTALTDLYNAIVAGVNEHRAALPGDCRFRRDTRQNLDADAPVSQWARGFVRGHTWLEESWNVPLAHDEEEQFGLVLMTLSFFASRSIASSFAEECGETDVARLAGAMRKVFPDAMAQCAEIGRTIPHVAPAASQKTRARAVTKTGRNDPCPCGSGVKYKKCCGAGVH